MSGPFWPDVVEPCPTRRPFTDESAARPTPEASTFRPFAPTAAFEVPSRVPSMSLTYWTLTVPSVPSATSSAAIVVPLPAVIATLSLIRHHPRLPHRTQPAQTCLGS